MSIVYIVTREAVYCHGVVFVSADREAAIKAAIEACRRERDDHHNFEVREHVLDQQPAAYPRYAKGSTDDDDPRNVGKVIADIGRSGDGEPRIR